MPVAAGAHDLDAQKRWESWAVERGKWRYRRALVRETKHGQTVARNLADLEPGQRIAEDVIAPLVERIKARQDEYHAALASPDLKKVPEEIATLLLLPPDTLAVVTVLSALSRTDPVALMSAALELGGHVMREVELRAWRESEKTAEDARKDEQAAWEPNLYELMVKRNPVVDRRVFAKWSQKAKRFTRADWDHATRVRVGTALLGLLVETDGWFEVVIQYARGKTKQVLQLTDMARGWIAQRHHQNECARPMLLPMICEPRDYAYLPTKAAELPEEDGEHAEN